MKKLITDNDTMYFDCDDDFYRFCVCPKAVIHDVTNADGVVCSYFDFDYTDAYKTAINNGTRFIIRDPDSQIFKHKCVSYRTISKPVKNLVECGNRP